MHKGIEINQEHILACTEIPKHRQTNIYVDAWNEDINVKDKEERITCKCEEMQKEIERGEKVLNLAERD